MDELRWTLVLLGLVALAGVYLYSRHSDKAAGQAARRERREPVIPGDEATKPADAVDAGPAAVPVSEAPAPPPQVPDKVVAIRLMARDRRGFPADKLILAFRQAGLRHGRYGIFHRQADGEDGPAMFSIASLTEPGSFDLTKLKTDRYPGISIFMLLPGPEDGVQSFDAMLGIARDLAKDLDGDLLDEHGSTLSIQRERYMREEIIQFQHQLGNG